jgi:hypothetical protein
MCLLSVGVIIRDTREPWQTEALHADATEPQMGPAQTSASGP